MLSLERDGFTAAQVKLALHHPHRRIDFRYELLDKAGNKKADLYNVLSGEITQQALAVIKRTARFTLRDDGEINYLSDRIRPIVRIYVPDPINYGSYYAFFSQQFAPLIEEAKRGTKGGWVEFPMGEFLLSSPIRYEEGGQVFREVDAYDGLTILNDDKFVEPYVIPAGTNYVDAVITILKGAGITKYNIESSDKVTSKDITFAIGKEKLFAINELLRGINYESIHVDVNGYFTSAYYRSPTDRASEYDYFTDSESVVAGGYSEELDVFGLPNVWVVVVKAEEEEAPMEFTANYTNDDPDNILSTVNRGRNIVDYREIDNTADQASLDAYTERLAYEANQTFGKVEFETALMPMHDYFDVFNVHFSDLDISGKYSETAWTMPLVVGGRMKHEIRRTEFI
ncbi:hypothetical protein FZC79_10510 [Rossellomorea vietnamensis]|uniref:Uncharacterized protein n=1 Tax=Rossellomorea vietnamensis TaxID=218284 RepID=A0A5D4KFJ4_9BACI|nr:hypothetical protein [Rossellomorea vietnamensis]TYR75590.1 hypothetical protein FZC79_10510 [Rossellomorea vietnamensis]